jgi:hypothetical protein
MNLVLDRGFWLWEQPSGFDFGDGVGAVAVQPGRAPFACARVRRLFDDTCFQDAAAEIALIQFLPKDDFVRMLQLAQGELARQQLEAYSAILQLVP